MAILRFEEAIKQIEGTDIEDFEKLWNLAIESCAQISDNCIDHHVAYECRDLKQ